MTCNYCGKSLNENDVFCSQCGNKVEPIVCDEVPAEEPTILEPETPLADAVEELSETEECEECVSCDDDVETEDFESNESEETEILCPESTEYEEELDGDEDVLDETVEFVKTTDPEDAVFENEEVYEEESETSEEVPKQTETVKKKKKKLAKIHKRGIGSHLGSFALSILLALLMITTLALFVARGAITENSIKEIFSSIELEEIKIDSNADKRELEELGIKCDSDNVLDIIYDNIDQEALKEPLTKDQFREIIKNDAVSEYFGDLIGKNLDAAVDGKKVSLITTDDIIGFIEKEEALVTDILGYELTDDHKNNLRTTLDTNFGDVFETLEIKELESVVGKAPAVIINVVFSDWLFIGLIVICALLIVLIFLVLRSFRLGLLYNGITIMIVNFIYLVCALALMFGILDLLISGINAELLTQVVSVVLWDLVIITFSAVFVGIVMIVVSKIIKKYLIRNKS